MLEEDAIYIINYIIYIDIYYIDTYFSLINCIIKIQLLTK